jgi:hypothetical protein
MAKAGVALSAASEAYESGKYQQTLTSIADFEQALGGKATAYSLYLKIMSYYKLKDYENCIAAVRKYQQSNFEDDDNAAEIRTVYTDAQTKVKAQIAEKQRQEEMRRQEEEAARQQAALEQEAAAKWETLKNTNSMDELRDFVMKYENTSLASVAFERFRDEAAWQQATDANSISSYEKYLNGTTLKNHAQEARIVLYPKQFSAAVENRDVPKMEEAYKNCVEFLDLLDETKQTMQEIMCMVYYEKGYELTETVSNYNRLKESTEMLEKCQQIGCYPDKAADIAKTIKSNTKRYEKMKKKAMKETYLRALERM